MATEVDEFFLSHYQTIETIERNVTVAVTVTVKSLTIHAFIYPVAIAICFETCRTRDIRFQVPCIACDSIGFTASDNNPTQCLIVVWLELTQKKNECVGGHVASHHATCNGDIDTLSFVSNQFSLTWTMSG